MPPTSSFSLEIQNSGILSEVIRPEFFGAGMLFDADRVHPGGNFEQTLSTLGITSVRYPGGTISEQFFDPSNPNAITVYDYFDIANDVPEPGDRTALPLTDYLEFIDRIGGQATIVLPTYRFFDLTTRNLKTTAESEISSFVRNLLEGDYGNFESINIEIGNEWYQDNFDWEPEEFGQLQSEIARIISETASSIFRRDDVSIFAQAGQNAQQNSTLASHFSGESANIDGVVTHIYGANSMGNPLGMGGAIRGRLNEIKQEWGLIDPNLQLAVTEWNVGEDGESNTIINGLMRSAPLLRIFAEMARADVDLAHLWSSQTPGPAGLSGRDSQYFGWSPTGYLFKMLHDGALDARIDTGSNFKLIDGLGKEIDYTYTFMGDDSTSVFLSSGVNQDAIISLDLSTLLAGASHVMIRTLTAAPGTTGIGYRDKAAFEFTTNQDFPQLLLANKLKITLGRYETAQIIITYGRGVTIEGDHQNAIDDNLVGTVFDDTLLGDLGNDQLFGRGGNDRLDGGAGNDTVVVRNEATVITERVNEGTMDRVAVSVSYVLAAGVEVEMLQTTYFAGDSAINLTGNAFARQQIVGNAGANRLDGGGGRNDTLTGSVGDDSYIVRSASDVIVEGVNQGTADRVFAATSFTLAADDNIEFLQTSSTTATTAINLTGNALAGQQIFGNAGANVLDGGGGIDTLAGSAGNDSYIVRDDEDVIVEAAGQGTGDRVFATISFALASDDNIEFLQTNSTAATTEINLTGNAISQVINGNAGANLIDGQGGNDTLTGGAGADRFVFSTMPGAGNIDRITDFAVGLDDILLRSSIFGAIGPSLEAREFRIGAAVDADDFILYNSATGALTYDSNGVASGGATQFATLTAGLALKFNDFIMV